MSHRADLRLSHFISPGVQQACGSEGSQCGSWGRRHKAQKWLTSASAPTAYVLFRWRTARKSATQFEPLQRRVERALRQGRDQTVCRRTAATCANLLRSLPSLWTFLRDPRVEPTNNDAERALRGIVIKRKISGPTRSRRGDEFIGRAFTAHESCRRQGRNLWDFLHQAVTAWIDKTAPPSLLPNAALSG